MEDQFHAIISNPTLVKLASLVIGIWLIWFVTKTIQSSFSSKIKDSDNRYKAKKITSILRFALIVLLFAIVFHEKLGGFTVALGVAGAGIAFALQEVIASFAGWVLIIFGGFYKSGDRVQLGGIKGDVMDIGVLRTTIMETGQWVDGDLYNGRIVLIANSFVFKEPVFNYSGDFPFLWDEIKIPIHFGSDYTKTKELLKRIGNEVVGDPTIESKAKWVMLQNKYKLEDARTTPMVSIVITNKWVEYTLRYVVEYKKRRETKTELFSRILAELEASNGEIKIA